MSRQFRSAQTRRAASRVGPVAPLALAVVAILAPAAGAAAPPSAGEGVSIATAPAESVAGAVAGGEQHMCAIRTERHARLLG